MRIDLNVDVRHLTRVEGHGNIRIQVKNGEILQARWDTVETPRFFEVMFKNKHYTSIGIMAARICGICSISHCLCSIRATEKAFGVNIPKTAERLRLLAFHGETLQSHILHILFLALPDFVNETSVIPLVQTRPEVIALAARLKGLANRLCDTVAGRSTHPVAFQVGGVTMVPHKHRLLGLQDELRHCLKDLEQVADLFAGFAVPDFTRQTEFVSLKAEKNYPFVGGSLMSSDGVEHGEKEYQAMTNEYLDPNNTSKWSRLSRESYAVGALARTNNNHAFLHPKALETARRLNLTPGCHNPFMNTAAQVVECVHVVHEAIHLIDELVADPACDPVKSGLGTIMAEVTPRAGEGVSAVEAPRGILFHHYVYDDSGRMQRANCVVPTTQNNANIHHDIKGLVEKFAPTPDMTDERLERLASMLVRAYDPCISCSVH
jgi:coenzyme F420-reducing hydrogenase alpha subunit